MLRSREVSPFKKMPTPYKVFGRFAGIGLSHRMAAKVRAVRASLSGTGGAMLYYALVFLVIALIAGFLGFGGVAFAAAGIAKILFFIFLVIFVVTLVAHLMRGGTTQ
jgi:uncharacterized membrane protein YtjA (UPF0391 family)